MKYAKVIKETWPEKIVGALRTGRTKNSSNYVDSSLEKKTQ